MNSNELDNIGYILNNSNLFIDLPSEIEKNKFKFKIRELNLLSNKKILIYSIKHKTYQLNNLYKSLIEIINKINKKEKRIIIKPNSNEKIDINDLLKDNNTKNMSIGEFNYRLNKRDTVNIILKEIKDSNCKYFTKKYLKESILKNEIQTDNFNKQFEIMKKDKSIICLNDENKRNRVFILSDFIKNII